MRQTLAKIHWGTTGRVLAALAALLLLVWVAQTISVRDALAALRRLQPLDLAILIVVNAAILAIFSARWWILLDALGHRIAFARLMAYRLTAFGISYFTPGPHFGGEPYQIYAMVRRHAVPPPDAIAAVALDKLLEMLINFAMLTLGVAVLILRHQSLEPWLERQLIIYTLLLLAMPVALLFSLLLGKRPLASLLARRRARPPTWLAAMIDAEAQAIRLFQRRPRALLLAAGVTLVSWACIVGEFWLLTRLLELPLDFVEAVTALVAARIAILLPMPAGLGALEAGQALAVSSLGLDPSFGVAVALVIRGRDVLLGLVGLGLGGAQGWRALLPSARDAEPLPVAVHPYKADRGSAPRG